MPLLSSLSSGSARSYGLIRSRSAPLFLNTVTTIFLGSQDWTAPPGSTTVVWVLVEAAAAVVVWEVVERGVNDIVD